MRSPAWFLLQNLSEIQSIKISYPYFQLLFAWALGSNTTYLLIVTRLVWTISCLHAFSHMKCPLCLSLIDSTTSFENLFSFLSCARYYVSYLDTHWFKKKKDYDPDLLEFSADIVVLPRALPKFPFWTHSPFLCVCGILYLLLWNLLFVCTYFTLDWKFLEDEIPWFISAPFPCPVPDIHQMLNSYF